VSDRGTPPEGEPGEEQRVRDATSRLFGLVEDGLYVAVAGALAIAGLILFGYAVYTFVDDIAATDLGTVTLELLDNLLLVFIITEVIHTIRAVIHEKLLLAEPFLIVGIVAAIRRLLVVSAEAKDLLGRPEFADAMLELGVLTSTALLLTLAVFFLRRTSRGDRGAMAEAG
jgi:hypothetical protein